MNFDYSYVISFIIVYQYIQDKKHFLKIKSSDPITDTDVKMFNYLSPDLIFK